MTHERAGGAPRGRALGTISSIVHQRTQTYTITRPTQTTGSLDQTTETTATHDEELWLFDARESSREVLAGERLTGSLGALGLDGIDIQPNDRLTHGAVTYEVESVVGKPDDADADGTAHSNTDYFVIQLTRYST